MKLRSTLLILISSLMLASFSPVFAADSTPTRSEQVALIQNQYNPLFDAEYARFLSLKTKILNDANMLRSFKATLADFLEVRRVIDSGLKSATSDLDGIKAYAEEEVGEYNSTLSLMETQAAKIKNKSITCIKGKLVQKVSSLAPKCPKDYKKK